MSTSAVKAAATRRREIFAAIASANGTDDATDAISHLLSVSREEAAEVLAAPLESFVGTSDTSGPITEAPDSFGLFPFRDDEAHVELFRKRSVGRTGDDGVKWDESRAQSELEVGLKRNELESAAWFVAVDTVNDKLIGLVFGEQLPTGDVDVAIWVDPEERKKGYGLRSLKQSRRELAAYFPGKHLIVRAPVAKKE